MSSAILLGVPILFYAFSSSTSKKSPNSNRRSAIVREQLIIPNLEKPEPIENPILFTSYRPIEINGEMKTIAVSNTLFPEPTISELINQKLDYGSLPPLPDYGTSGSFIIENGIRVGFIGNIDAFSKEWADKVISEKYAKVNDSLKNEIREVYRVRGLEEENKARSRQVLVAVNNSIGFKF